MLSQRTPFISIVCAAILVVLAGSARATTWHVAQNGSGDFVSIQGAIYNAAPGDTILVAPGTYYESIDWEIDLTIKGAGIGQSIIDLTFSEGYGVNAWALSSSSLLQGFTIQNSSNTAMYNNGSSLSITNCAFVHNLTYGDGGALVNDSGNSTITNCIFIDNQATDSGGAIYNISCSPTIINCVFLHNSVTFGGGAIRNQGFGESPVITNCTFVNNSASFGSAVASGDPWVSGYTGNTRLTNCILWGNTGSSVAVFDGNSTLTTLSHTDSQDLTNATRDASGNFGADPQFVDTVNGDLHPGYRSPCINAGDNSVVASPPFPMDAANAFIVDLDRNARIRGTAVDLGAYEVQKLPIANAGQNQIVTANHSGHTPTDFATVTLDGSGSSDPDGDSLTYAWDDGQGDTSTAVKPQFTLSPGQYTFTLTVTDPDGLTDTASVTVTVNNAPNRAPVANPASNSPVTVPHDGNPATNLATIQLDATGSTDPDGDDLHYRWKEGSTIIGTTAKFSVQKPAGDYTFTLLAIDTYGTPNTKDIQVHVNPETNGTPTLTVPATAGVNIGCPVTVQATATDPDGDAITYSKASGPTWATVSASGAVTLNPPSGTVGTFTVAVKATDPYGLFDQKNITVTVCPIIIDGVTLSKKNGVTTVQFNVRNTDGITVATVSLNSSTLKGIATVTAMPITFTQLKQGVSKQVQLKFNGVPSGPAQFIVNGTSSSGPVNANLTVNVP